MRNERTGEPEANHVLTSDAMGSTLTGPVTRYQQGIDTIVRRVRGWPRVAVAEVASEV
jgi:hypothetical protein